MHRRFHFPAWLLLTALLGSHAFAAEEDPSIKAAKRDRDPAGVSLADDPLTAMKKFSIAPGLKIDVFAAEPQIENVVNFTFDEKGRVYVVETGRRRTSVYDIRQHRDWIDDDLSFRTVDDRINFLKRKLTQDNPDLADELKIDRNGDGVFDWHDLEVESERIKLLEATKGDHHADKVTVFADGFNTLVSGVAAGVLAHHGNVYFTCIPDLWMLRDTKGTGVADVRTSLQHGFGVHIAYGGHDMHGLKLGPDGRLYFSIADRGSHLVTKEGRTIELPDTGAVFRCNPDGSQLEPFAMGLRNPQELAFDQYGNLFTGDNNADGGDKARWTYVVEGADYGWRMGWQHLPKLGAWNSEKLWELAPLNPAAYLLPPVAHIGHGPAGIAYYPGTGMPDRFKNHFFLTDFPGGVRYFETKPSGATFTVENPNDYLQNNSADKMDGKLLWGLYPTDIDFAPDGGAYVLDWVQGWEKTGKGRLYRLHDPAMDNDPRALDTAKILAAGMTTRSLPEIISLLGHPDQRVRLEAQFTLAAPESWRHEWSFKKLSLSFPSNRIPKALNEAARTNSNQLTRLHAIWALGQIGRESGGRGLYDLVPLLKDADPEICAQVCKVMGEARYPDSFEGLVANLNHASPRVRFFAAQALGNLGQRAATKPLIELARTNQDRFIRHAIVFALVQLRDNVAIFTAAYDPSAEARMVGLLAMRRLGWPEIKDFLNAPEPQFVLEAARAINDVPITAAQPQLAALISATNKVAASALTEPVVRRAINAQFRLGAKENAEALVAYAHNDQAAPAMRVDALDALGDWAKPSDRDRIVGLWRPLPERDKAIATAALEPALPALFTTGPAEVRIAALNSIGKLGFTNAAERVFALVGDTSAAAEVRAAALRALAALKSAKLPDALKLARADQSEVVRKEAGRLAGQGDAADAVAALSEMLQKGSRSEKQTALASLGGIKGKDADRLISKWMDNLLNGTLVKELQLDVLEAARKRTAPSIKAKVEKYEAAKDPKDDLAKYRETLFGGDAKAGREIFFERADIGCFRCHKISGEGGEVGPELTGILTRQNRDYILESIVLPNKQIAKGFESLLVVMKDGLSHVGVLKNETDDALTLNSPEDGLITLKKADIKSSSHSLSPMPEGLGELLSRQDLRNLIEFVATAKAPVK